MTSYYCKLCKVLLINKGSHLYHIDNGCRDGKDYFSISLINFWIKEGSIVDNNSIFNDKLKETLDS